MYGIYYIFQSYLFICYSDISLCIFNMDCFNCDMLCWISLTRIHSESHDSNKLARTTPTCLLRQFWHTHSHCNSDMLTFTTDLLTHTTLTYSFSKLWYAWSHRSDMLTLTSMTIWLCRYQPNSGGSGFAGRVALALLVTVDLDLLDACW